MNIRTEKGKLNLNSEGKSKGCIFTATKSGEVNTTKYGREME